MYTVNFRILVGAIHGSNVFVNGSAFSAKQVDKGSIVLVRGQHSISGVFAEVIDSVPKIGGIPREYNWEIV